MAVVPYTRDERLKLLCHALLTLAQTMTAQLPVWTARL